MQRHLGHQVAWLVLPLIAWIAVVTTRAQDRARSDTPPAVQQSSAPMPASGCAQCHANEHETWTTARHGKMLQPAGPASVVGDFSQAAVTLRGARYALAHVADRFTIAGPFPTAKDQVHRVDYTLGSRRIQHYLTTLADGRIVVLPPTWDVERREWIHNLDIVNPDEGAPNPVQVWNSNCFGCHASGQVKGYDPLARRYETRWTDFGTSCERCHGPGARARGESRRGPLRLREGRVAQGRACRRGDGRAHGAAACTIDGDLRGLSFASRHHGARLPRRWRLLRSLHAGAGVWTVGQDRPALLGRRPAAAILE